MEVEIDAKKFLALKLTIFTATPEGVQPGYWHGPNLRYNGATYGLHLNKHEQPLPNCPSSNPQFQLSQSQTVKMLFLNSPCFCRHRWRDFLEFEKAGLQT